MKWIEVGSRSYPIAGFGTVSVLHSEKKTKVADTSHDVHTYQPNYTASHFRRQCLHSHHHGNLVSNITHFRYNCIFRFRFIEVILLLSSLYIHRTRSLFQWRHFPFNAKNYNYVKPGPLKTPKENKYFSRGEIREKWTCLLLLYNDTWVNSMLVYKDNWMQDLTSPYLPFPAALCCQKLELQVQVWRSHLN